MYKAGAPLGLAAFEAPLAPSEPSSRRPMAPALRPLWFFLLLRHDQTTRPTFPRPARLTRKLSHPAGSFLLVSIVSGQPDLRLGPIITGEAVGLPVGNGALALPASPREARRALGEVAMKHLKWILATAGLLFAGGIAYAQTQAPSWRRDGEVARSQPLASTRAAAAISQSVAADRGKEGTESPEKLIADFSLQIRRHPRDVLAYCGRGKAYARLGKLDQAIADYSIAIQLRPTLVEPYGNRGLAFRKQQRYDLAATDFTKVIQLSPETARGHFDRGETYRMAGQMTKASADFARAVQLDPMLAKASGRQGLSQLKQGNYENAIQHLDQAIRLDPADGVAIYDRGLAYGERGDFAKALIDFGEVLRPDEAKSQHNYNHLANGRRGFGLNHLFKKLAGSSGPERAAGNQPIRLKLNAWGKRIQAAQEPTQAPAAVMSQARVSGSALSVVQNPSRQAPEPLPIVLRHGPAEGQSPPRDTERATRRLAAPRRAPLMQWLDKPLFQLKSQPLTKGKTTKNPYVDDDSPAETAEQGPAAADPMSLARKGPKPSPAPAASILPSKTPATDDSQAVAKLFANDVSRSASLADAGRPKTTAKFKATKPGGTAQADVAPRVSANSHATRVPSASGPAASRWSPVLWVLTRKPGLPRSLSAAPSSKTSDFSGESRLAAAGSSSPMMNELTRKPRLLGSATPSETTSPFSRRFGWATERTHLVRPEGVMIRNSMSCLSRFLTDRRMAFRYRS